MHQLGQLAQLGQNRKIAIDISHYALIFGHPKKARLFRPRKLKGGRKLKGIRYLKFKYLWYKNPWRSTTQMFASNLFLSSICPAQLLSIEIDCEAVGCSYFVLRCKNLSVGSVHVGNFNSWVRSFPISPVDLPLEGWKEKLLKTIRNNFLNARFSEQDDSVCS